MSASKRPRFLQMLRVEDENVPSPLSRLPITDLGRVGKWNTFVRGLTSGGVHVEERNGEVHRIRAQPDIITVDFRFDGDASTPSFTPDPELSDHDIFGNVQWSQALRTKNTGVLMGATLMGMAAQRDLPTVTTLHTLSPADTGNDISTVLLVAQMLASAGRDFPEGADPFEIAFRYMRALPEECEEAVHAAIQPWRTQLLVRLGLQGGNRSGKLLAPPCLLVQPQSSLYLLTQFDAAADEMDLDDRLSKVGLEVWDRDGQAESLDIRSLFLDLLEGTGLDREWGMLPLHSVKQRGQTMGKVLGFVQAIQKGVGRSYEDAAQVVQANLRGHRKAITAHRPPVTRLLGVVFAFVEESIKVKQEFNNRLGEPWDPVGNCPSQDHDDRSLSQMLLALARAMKEMPDQFTLDEVPPDGYWPITGRPYSILQGVQRYISTTESILTEVLQYSDEEDTLESEQETAEDVEAEMLHDTDVGRNTSKLRVRILRNLLDHLCTAGLVTVESRPYGGQTRPYYRLRDGVSLTSLSARVPSVRRESVVNLLGYRPRGRVSHELDPIITGAGYPDYSAFLSRLERGPIPAHLAQAARWYVETYHSELLLGDWPPQCSR